MPTRNMIEQGRARHAYATAIQGKNSANKEEFKSNSQKVPMLVKTNGLGATLTFMNAKKGSYTLILERLEDWLLNESILSAMVRSTPGNNIVEKIIECRTHNYKALTIESIAYLGWLKRFANGLIEK